jgi:hypothetical protein
MDRVPLLAGVGINDDGLARDLGQLIDEAADQLGSGAIDADSNHLGLLLKQLRARAQCLTMGNVHSIPASKAEIRCHVWIRVECGEDGPGFFQRRNAFQGQKVGIGFGEHRDAPAVELDQLLEGAVVIAVILRAVVQHRAIGSERSGDPDLSR